jgi:hypothetical protein
MNPDEIGSVVRQVITLVLSSAAASAYVNNSQAVAIAAGLGAMASVVWSIFAHWNLKKVPENAKVIGG